MPSTVIDSHPAGEQPRAAAAGKIEGWPKSEAHLGRLGRLTGFAFGHAPSPFSASSCGRNEPGPHRGWPSRSVRRAVVSAERVDALRTHRMDYAAEFLDLCCKPLQLLLGDAGMLRLTGFDVGFLELLEQCTIAPRLARPDVGQPRVDSLGLGAQESEVVHVGGLCRAAGYAERAWIFAVYQHIAGNRRGIVFPPIRTSI